MVSAQSAALFETFETLNRVRYLHYSTTLTISALYLKSAINFVWRYPDCMYQDQQWNTNSPFIEIIIDYCGNTARTILQRTSALL